MRKSLKSIVVVIFAVILSFVLVAAPPAQAGKGNKDTILETLVQTDGSQALVAAIKVLDESDSTFDVEFAELLDDKKAKLILLAPSNAGFALLLRLDPRALDGLDPDTIARVLPILLDKVSLNKQDLYNVLLKHVSVVEKKKYIFSKNDLLKEGHIPVEDGSDFPVSIGGKGLHINYESHITEHDVFTKNGVIHYLDNVIVDAEEPPQPPSTEACNQEKCLTDDELRAQCDDFLYMCLLEADSDPSISEEECVAGALLICNEYETEIEPL